MNDLGKGIATAGVWYACALMCQSFPPIAILVAPCALFATVAVWAPKSI